ncbi:MAG: hypothetical protein U0176_08840 [Bacteroidia bacterium]
MQAKMEARQLSYLFPSNSCPKDTSVQEYYLEQQAGRFVLNRVNAFYFKKMLAEIGRREVHLVWINMPLNRGVRQPSDRYYADFETFLHNCLPSDISYHPFTYRDACDFKDFSHLHEVAAEAFTKSLWK